jgi:hypothetical protein
VASMCIYASTSSIWEEAWRTGEVLRFASQDPTFSRFFAGFAAQFKGFSPKEQVFIAGHNLTRAWIELITVSAAQIGFDAIHGFEIDRHAGIKPPPAVSWLAVMNAAAVTSPVWL